MRWGRSSAMVVRGRIGFLSNEMYGDQTSLLAQVHIEFPDGTSRTFATGRSRRARSEGPIRSNDTLDGENL